MERNRRKSQGCWIFDSCCVLVQRVLIFFFFFSKVYLEARKLRNVTRYAYKWIAYTEIKVRKRLLLESQVRYSKHLASTKCKRQSSALVIQCRFRGHNGWVSVAPIFTYSNIHFTSNVLTCFHRDITVIYERDETTEERCESAAEYTPYIQS